MTYTPFSHPALDLQIRKNALERDIAISLFDAVEENKLDIAMLQSTAKELLLALEDIDSDRKLEVFVQGLGQKFSFLSSLTIKNNPKADPKEEEIMNKLSSFINSQNN